MLITGGSYNVAVIAKKTKSERFCNACIFCLVCFKCTFHTVYFLTCSSLFRLRETRCKASVGIGPNMMLARVATRYAKPDGVHYLPATGALPALPPRSCVYVLKCILPLP